MNLAIVGFWIALTVPTDFSSLTVEGSVYLEASSYVESGYGHSAIATPFGWWYNSKKVPERISYDDIRWEEGMHVQQMEALGPYFWPFYLLTCGDVFEPYIALCYRVFPEFRTTEYSHPYDYNRDKVWLPDERRFPQFRVQVNPGEVSLTFMPGYKEFIEEFIRETF